jgi:hypothetical protein
LRRRRHFCYKKAVTTTPALLIMLSIDGLRADYIDDPTVDLPCYTLAFCPRAERMPPIFPSVTGPWPTSIYTGVSPARHGVLGNLVFDRASGKPVEHYGDRTDAPVRVPTLWDRLHATGQRTAAVCWPKTRGIAAVADNIPEFYEQELFEAYASRPLWTELAAKRLPVDRYGPWSAQHPMGPMQDWLTLEAARHPRGPPAAPPCSCTSSPSIPSSTITGWTARRRAGRSCGWTRCSAAARHPGRAGPPRDHHPDGLRRPRVRERLQPASPEPAPARGGLLDLDRHGDITRRRAWVAGNRRLRARLRARRRAAHHRGRLAERFRALPGLDVLEPARFAALGLPAPGPDSMQGDLMLAAHEGVLITGHSTPEAAAAAPVLRAAHGHAPSLPLMGAGFLMAGPGEREGARLDKVSILELGTTAARLLAVGLPGAAGTPLVEALAAR